jgi:DNA-binding transcriptional MerR regulator
LAERDKTQHETPGLTVHELAERVGMTVRNLREWQTLGLLPRPEVRGRTGFYDPSVVERIEGIQRLHAEGFPLELIRRMLDASGASGTEVIQFARALRAPFRESDAPARLEHVTETLEGLGMSSRQIADATDEIRRHLDKIATLFEQVWLDHIWEPFVEAGMPEDRLPGLQATLAEVQPIALDAVIGLFTIAMEAKIEEGIAREIARAADARRASQ